MTHADDPNYVPPAELPPYLAAMPQARSFEEVHRVFTHKAFGQGGHELSWDFLGGTQVVLDGREHRKRQRLVRPLFTREALHRYEEDVLVPAVDRVLAECERGDDGLVHTDLVETGRRILTQIAAAVIGLDDVKSRERTDRLAWFAGHMATGSRLQFATGDIDTLRDDLLEIKGQFLEEFVRPSRARREQLVADVAAGERSEDELPEDLLTILAKNPDPDWDADQVNREVILYLVGSTLTTAQAVPHAVFHIDHWLRAHPDQRHRVQDIEFLRHAAYESMRLHASSPAQIRRAMEEVALEDGCTYAQGTDVAVVTVTANRDEQVYGPDPNRYDPDRKVLHSRMDLYGHTFAEGAHRCIGEYLAAGLRPTRNDEGTQGMIIQILTALYERNVRLEPDDPPRMDPATVADFYVTCPVVFDPLDKDG